GKGGTPVERRHLRKLGVRTGAAAMLVDRDPARDRVRPGAKVLRVAKVRVRPQRAQEGLLERVLRPVASEATDQEGEDLLAVLFVETLEGRQHHRHHPETYGHGEV